METSAKFIVLFQNMRNLKNKKETCYGCIYFFRSSNRCNWFYIHRHQTSKQIPENVINNGCSKRESKKIKGPKWIQHLINVFQGEII